MKIALLNRAKMNSGDHLIFHSTKELMKHFGHKVFDINPGWKRFNKDTLKVVNNCDVLMIAGGPCVSDRLYPTIYPLSENLDNIKPNIILFGVGLKVGSNINTDFNFTNDSKNLLKRSTIYTRDEVTREFFIRKNIPAKFGGCSSWFNGGNIVSQFDKKNIKKVLFSARRSSGEEDIEVLNVLIKKFKDKEIAVSLNHGFEKNKHKEIISFCKKHRIDILDISGSCKDMLKICKNYDFHVGFRVHTHLCCLSQGTKSLLISIDSRGAGQSLSVGSHEFDINIAEIKKLNKMIDLSLKSEYENVLKKINNRFLFIKKEFNE